jgi:hypothetical protein
MRTARTPATRRGCGPEVLCREANVWRDECGCSADPENLYRMGFEVEEGGFGDLPVWTGCMFAAATPGAAIGSPL